MCRRERKREAGVSGTKEGGTTKRKKIRSQLCPLEGKMRRGEASDGRVVQRKSVERSPVSFEEE